MENNNKNPDKSIKNKIIKNKEEGSDEDSMEEDYKTPQKRVLINLHNCIADLNSALLLEWYKYKASLNQKVKKRDIKTFKFANFAKNFGSKESNQVRKMIEQLPQNWYIENVKEIEGSIAACKQMLGFGIEIILFANPLGSNIYSPSDIFNWVSKHFQTADWFDRVVIINQKNLLKGDIIVDDDEIDFINDNTFNFNENKNENENKEENKNKNENKNENENKKEKNNQNQLLLIYERPWNSSLKIGKRFSKWANWKVEMQLDPLLLISSTQYFRHGSPDSIDIDLYYLFKKFPKKNKFCFLFCSGSADDRNIITVDKKFGVVDRCHKGNPDECNNSLFSTYYYHQQKWPCPVKRKKIRIVPLKVTTTSMRNVLGKVTLVEDENNIYRNLAKNAIREKDFLKTVNAFNEIDFSKLGKGLTPSDLKNIAFQLGQSFGLIIGKELYTKKEIAEEFPELKIFLSRDPNANSYLSQLSDFRDKISAKMKTIIFSQHPKFPFLHLRSPENFFEKEENSQNFFLKQSRGMILELRFPGNCLMFPFSFFIKDYFSPDWPEDSFIDVEKNFKNLKFEKKSCFLHIFKWNDEFIFSDENGFESKDIEKIQEILKNQKIDFKNLNFEKYWHIFILGKKKEEEGEIFLIGLRNKISHDLVFTEEELKKEANLININFLSLDKNL